MTNEIVTNKDLIKRNLYRIAFFDETTILLNFKKYVFSGFYENRFRLALKVSNLNQFYYIEDYVYNGS